MSKCESCKADLRYTFCICGTEHQRQAHKKIAELEDEIKRVQRASDDWQKWHYYDSTVLGRVIRERDEWKDRAKKAEAEIERLREAMNKATRSEDHWQEEARRYCGNADYWKARAEKAESERDECAEMLREISANSDPGLICSNYDEVICECKYCKASFKLVALLAGIRGKDAQ